MRLAALLQLLATTFHDSAAGGICWVFALLCFFASQCDPFSVAVRQCCEVGRGLIGKPYSDGP